MDSTSGCKVDKLDDEEGWQLVQYTIVMIKRAHRKRTKETSYIWDVCFVCDKEEQIGFVWVRFKKLYMSLDENIEV